MQITKIEFRGLIDIDSGYMPMAMAEATRNSGDEYIEVTIMTPPDNLGIRTTTHTHSVDACDVHDIRSMAECLQRTLEGFTGPAEAVDKYFEALLTMVD